MSAPIKPNVKHTPRNNCLFVYLFDFCQQWKPYPHTRERAQFIDKTKYVFLVTNYGIGIIDVLKIYRLMISNNCFDSMNAQFDGCATAATAAQFNFDKTKHLQSAHTHWHNGKWNTRTHDILMLAAIQKHCCMLNSLNWSITHHKFIVFPESLSL